MKAIEKKPVYKNEEEQRIAEANELTLLNTWIRVNAMALSNARRDIKRLMKEKQLLINIKKKWKT